MNIYIQVLYVFEFYVYIFHLKSININFKQNTFDVIVGISGFGKSILNSELIRSVEKDGICLFSASLKNTLQILNPYAKGVLEGGYHLLKNYSIVLSFIYAIINNFST